ncbi:MAG: hypothetical protein IKP86_08870, partial [Anaerolineaceae bacterium]|nr:hypothetical protein [Anaerolineaceae bacterium]
MKRTVIILFLTGLMLLSFAAVSAQEGEELPLSREFSALKIREQYNQPVRAAFYRFSPDIRFFEPIDLSYFPHEKWNKN